MNTKIEPGPLFKNANELHEALIEYAEQALEAALRSREPWHTESIAGDPVEILSETKLATVFAEHARERMAQIANAIWIEHELVLEKQIVVDGKPLSPVEVAIYGAVYGASFARVNVPANAAAEAIYAVATHRKVVAR